MTKLSPLADLLLKAFALNPDSDEEEVNAIKNNPIGQNATKEDLIAAHEELLVAGFVAPTKLHS